MKEHTDLRTPWSKVYQVSPTKRRIKTSNKVRHVPEDFTAWRQGQPVEFKDADPRWVKDGASFRSAGTWYDITVAADLGCMSYRSKAGTGHVELTLSAIGLKRQGFKADPEIDGRKLWFRGVDTDYDLYFLLEPARFRIFKVLYSADAAKTNEWEIVTHNKDGVLVNFDTKGWDNFDNTNIRTDETSRRRGVELVQTVIPQKDSTKFVEEWTGQTIKVDRKTRIKQKDTHAVFPVEIDFDISETIAADADDGWVYYNGTWQVSNPRIKSSSLGMAWRFQSVGVGQGDTIDSAAIRISQYYSTDAEVDVDFYMEDTDDAAAWASTDSVSPTLTTAKTSKTSWPGSGSAHNDSHSITITAAVQEVVDRGSWASGNDMRVYGKKVAVTTDFWAQDYPSANAADLYIDYSAGGGGFQPAWARNTNKVL